MENTVATVRSRKRTSGGNQKKGEKCPVTEETTGLSEDGWPTMKVESLVSEAMAKVKKQGQRTIDSLFRPKAPSVTAIQAAPQLDINQNRKTTSSKPVSESTKRKRCAENILELADSLGIENYQDVKEAFQSEEDLPYYDLGKRFQKIQDMEEQLLKGSKGKGWKISKFKDARKTFHQLRDEVRSKLTEIGALMKPEVTPGVSRIEEWTRMGPRIARSSDLKRELLDLLPEVRNASRDWKHKLDKRKLEVEVEADRLRDRMEVSNFSLSWWEAMAAVENKFNEAGDKAITSRMYNTVTIGGFQKEVYRQAADYFTFLRVTGSEFAKLGALMDALNLPSSSSKKLLGALKQHLPVAELRINGRRLLVDCDLLRRCPELIIRLTLVLQAQPERKVKVIEKSTASLARNMRANKRNTGKAFHKKFPGSLEVAKSLVMTGVAGDEEATVADPKRRSELGMAV